MFNEQLMDDNNNKQLPNDKVLKVINFYKPFSCTPLQCVNKLKEKYQIYRNKKIGYAGRLDPMARGVLILLVGEENRVRKKYEHMDKTYSFICLLGISTDTYDVLGEITGFDPSNKDVTYEELQKLCKSFIGKRMQKYPPYSSVRVNGKLIFEWAREGRLDEIEIPSKEVEIYDIIVKNNVNKISMSALYDYVERRITLLTSGDFRQEKILQGWKKLRDENPDREFIYFGLRAHVSQGTYIRNIVNDIGQLLGTYSLTLDILRESVGDYELKDSIYIED